MQCPRCYFSNPAGTRVCEYCGARLEGTTDTQTRPASASGKRKTMLGPMPTQPARSEPPRPQVPIDPEDPFRIAALGVGTREAQPTFDASTVAVPPPPPPAPPLPSAAPTAPPQRPTIVSSRPTTAPAIGGVALVVDAQGAARSVVLREGRTRIGRRPDAEIVIDDPEASGDHALLRIEGERAWLLDTSANGTHIAGMLCINDRADLHDGTVLRVGQTVVVVKLLSGETRSHLVGTG